MQPDKPQTPPPAKTEAAPAPAPVAATPPPPTQQVIDPNIPEGNTELLVLKRHPFGLVAMYLQAIVGLGGALTLLFVLVPGAVSGQLQDQIMSYLMIFAVLAVAIVAIVLLIATSVYLQNRWIISADSVHQVLQRGLFNRQTSELSMANIEDVTAEQKGILAKLFGFGTLRAETAGELPYFHFNYCPNPEKYARIILDARERFINETPEQAKRANDLLNAPGVRR